MFFRGELPTSKIIPLTKCSGAMVRKSPFSGLSHLLLDYTKHIMYNCITITIYSYHGCLPLMILQLWLSTILHHSTCNMDPWSSMRQASSRHLLVHLILGLTIGTLWQTFTSPREISMFNGKKH